MAQTKIKAGLFEGIIGNGTDGYFLMSNGDGTMTWAPSITPPTISSIDYPGSATAADPAGGETITVTGAEFKPGASITVDGTTAPIVSYISATEITFTTPEKTAGDYDVVVTNTDGGTATSINGISYNGVPAWTTPGGSLGSFASDTTISTITLQASEPDAGTITFNITSGALPTGLSLTGADIDGTTSIVNADTTYNFTITAVDDESQSTGRAFFITIEKYILVSSEHFTINTYIGNAGANTVTQSIEGKIGTAADFNGSSSSITGALAVDNRNSKEYSVSFWFNTTSTNESCLFGGIEDTTEDPVFKIVLRTDGHIDLEHRSNVSGAVNTIQGATNFSDGSWHHIVAWINNNQIALYVDGNTQPNSPLSLTDPGNCFVTSPAIGADNRRGTLTQFFDGKIDQVRIFDKAISSSEVTTLYNETYASSTKSTTDIFGDGSGVALYEFEEGAKSTGAVKHYLHVGDAGGQNTSVRINSIDSEFTYTRPDGYAEWGGSFDPSNTAYDYQGSSSNVTFSEGNKKWDKDGSYFHAVWSTNGYSSGKYYLELEFLAADLIFGLSTSETADTVNSGAAFYDNAITYFSYTAQKRIYSSTAVSGGAVLATNDVIGLAVDFDNKTLKYYINNTLVETETLAGYDGTPTDVSFTGTSFQPDLVWIKNRDNANNHVLFDSIRGATNWLNSNNTNAQYNNATTADASLTSNGFTTGTSDQTNRQGDDLVAWCWKAGGSVTPNNNTNGTITSTVSANPNAGFSIVKYTGNATAGATIGHGLSATIDLLIVKNLTDGTQNWRVQASPLGGTKGASLNTADAFTTASYWNNTDATDTVFTVDNSAKVNATGDDFIAYCFHSVDGYQKVGSYSGGTAGVQVTTGFKPRWVILKNTTTAGDSWLIFDTIRSGETIQDDYLLPNASNAEGVNNANVYINVNSTGFTVANTFAISNGSGNTYIYLAIA